MLERMKSRSTVSQRDKSARVCPTCGRRYLPDETSAPPFCSDRCQLADLGRWLDEEIGLPHEGDAGDTPVEYLEDADEYVEDK